MAANSYRNVFLSNIGTIPSTGAGTLSLGIGEIGIFDARTNLATTTPNFPVTRSIQIIQGTTSKLLPQGMLYGNQSWRSPEIPAGTRVVATGLKGQRPQNMIVTLGYDGVDTTKTMAPSSGKPVRVYLTLTGQPIANLVGGTGNHPAQVTETFDLQLPCVTDCIDNCSATVDCNVVSDNLIKLVNERKLPGGQLLSKYVKATKLLSCTSPSGVATTSCRKWTLTIADTGDNLALGIVQASYPTLVITRDVYSAPYSTYIATICPSSQPATFQSSQSPVIPNCTTCPSGYTYVAQLWIYTVQRPDAGTAGALTTLKSDYSDTAAFRLNYANGTSTYEIHKSIATVPTAVGADIVIFVGTIQNNCILSGVGVPTAWTIGDACTKATKVYQVTVADTVCGDNLLADLQAEYGSGVYISASGLCTHQYRLTITSDNASCETCDEQSYTFTTPAPFRGSIWALMPGQTGEGTSCVCGVKFESAYVARDRAECYFDDVSYEVEPLFLYVSSNDPDFRDYSVLCNDLETFPVTLIQQAKYAQGYGSFVADQYKQSRFYFNNPWYHEPVVRDAIGYQLGVGLQSYYDQIILEWRVPFTGAGNFSGFGITQFEQYEFTFYFPAGQSVTFVNALNSWLVSNGNEPVSV